VPFAGPTTRISKWGGPNEVEKMSSWLGDEENFSD